MWCTPSSTQSGWQAFPDLGSAFPRNRQVRQRKASRTCRVEYGAVDVAGLRCDGGRNRVGGAEGSGFSIFKFFFSILCCQLFDSGCRGRQPQADTPPFPQSQIQVQQLWSGMSDPTTPNGTQILKWRSRKRNRSGAQAAATSTTAHRARSTVAKYSSNNQSKSDVPRTTRPTPQLRPPRLKWQATICGVVEVSAG